MRLLSCFLFALSAICVSFSAQATDYCVATTQQLRDALDAAEVDGGDSVIQLRSGTYTLASNARYEPVGEGFLPAGKLTLRGGYSSDCASYSLNGGATTLTSSSGSTLEFVTQTGGVSIAGVTFNGAHLLLSSRVLSYCVNNRPAFNLRRLRMDQAGVAISSQCHDVLIDTSLFTNGVAVPNTTMPAGSSIDIRVTDYEGERIGSIDILGSTVVNGRVNLRACCSFTGSAEIYNSVFERSGSELFLEDIQVLARSNRYDGIVLDGSAALLPGSGDNLSVAADLDADFRPNVASALLNSGTANVPGGLGTVDQAGGERVIGPRVDRGARESIFDGTGVFTVTNTLASGVGSLAWAVDSSNADPGFNSIRFNIAGGCPRVISLSGALQVRESVTFDGRTQPGYSDNTSEVGWNGVPCVVLSGAGGIGIEAHGDIGEGLITVRGLAFEGFGLAISLPFGEDHQILGNQFGGRVGTSGLVLAGNEQAIALIGGGRSRIGGNATASRNLISDSSDVGVLITTFIGLGGNDNEVVNNLIGLDKDGNTALPNGTGIIVTGGDNLIRGNRIGGNAEDGVRISGQTAIGNRIEDNFIGGGVGFLSLTAGNGRMGVMVQGDASGNRIGPENIIGRNGDDGVRIFTTAGGNNRVTGNQIRANGALGIDIADNGITTNDDDSIFCGTPPGCLANRSQNFPVIASAVRRTTGLIPVGRPVEIRGTLRSSVGGPYQIEVFGGESCEANDHGEGPRLLGTVSLQIESEPYCPTPGGLCFVCTNGNCTKEFSLHVPEIDLVPGDVITATATDAAGNTSEFSACTTVTLETTQGSMFSDGFED